MAPIMLLCMKGVIHKKKHQAAMVLHQAAIVLHHLLAIY